MRATQTNIEGRHRIDNNNAATDGRRKGSRLATYYQAIVRGWLVPYRALLAPYQVFSTVIPSRFTKFGVKNTSSG